MAQDHIEGREPSVGRGLALARSRLRPIMAWTLLSASEPFARSWESWGTSRIVIAPFGEGDIRRAFEPRKPPLRQRIRDFFKN